VRQIINTLDSQKTDQHVGACESKSMSTERTRFPKITLSNEQYNREPPHGLHRALIKALNKQIKDLLVKNAPSIPVLDKSPPPPSALETSNMVIGTENSTTASASTSGAAAEHATVSGEATTKVGTAVDNQATIIPRLLVAVLIKWEPGALEQRLEGAQRDKLWAEAELKVLRAKLPESAAAVGAQVAKLAEAEREISDAERGVLASYARDFPEHVVVLGLKVFDIATMLTATKVGETILPEDCRAFTTLTSDGLARFCFSVTKMEVVNGVGRPGETSFGFIRSTIPLSAETTLELVDGYRASTPFA